MPQFARVEGLDATVTSFRRSAATAPNAALGVVTRHAEKIAERWRDSVPVVSSTLHDSIDHFARYEDGDPVGTVYSDWMVARFREYGTATQPPHGEANAALEAEVDAFARDIKAIPSL